MSSCLSGGGRAYRLDLEIIKSPTTSWISNSSSPSSSHSESTNSALSISTRKPRTPRKRPNQTYNEAASILSTAHPKIFPCKHLKNPCKLTKSSFEIKNNFLLEPSELLIRPFQVIDSSGFLLPIFEKPRFLTRPKSAEKSCQSPGESDSERSYLEIYDDSHQDFDAVAILDEDIEEGIDSIMENFNMKKESATNASHDKTMPIKTFCYGCPLGLGFDYGFGVRRESRATRNVDEEDDCWRFPSVIDIKMAKNRVEKKKKVEIKNLESSKENAPSNILPNQENSICETAQGESIPQPNARLFLKLNYDNILDAWSDKDTPFSGDSPVSNTAGNNVQVRLAQIDLFSENVGIRDASVLRYKEKRRSRFFSKKITYQVRKVNADKRPRIKGRFVRTPNSPGQREGMIKW
ncbi:protein CHLOROPLAST IMPORT APPARATUS 2-like [Primulina tabacum]|uniref:protein CHLOROPLAST IMPORT APPARATUS 2-like n=1 Tax=Primulina tabacum TaxID=48773 RepID=UPI003F5A64E0